MSDVNAVAALHYPETQYRKPPGYGVHFNADYCHECDSPWPCQTVKLLKAT